MLGRHVEEGADDLVLAGEGHGHRRLADGVRGAVQLGESEVEQLDTLLGDENIGGLEVPMRDAFFVRGVEGIADLRGVFQRLVERQRAFERRPVDKLHHQIVGSDVVQVADVGMIERGDGAGLALETLVEFVLRATMRSRRVSVALYTSPMPPAPMGARIS